MNTVLNIHYNCIDLVSSKYICYLEKNVISRRSSIVFSVVSLITILSHYGTITGVLTVVSVTIPFALSDGYLVVKTCRKDEYLLCLKVWG
jgi:hypothetical protein